MGGMRTCSGCRRRGTSMGTTIHPIGNQPLLADLPPREVVLHLERAGALDCRAGLEVRLRDFGILRLHPHPEPRRGEPSRLEVRILVPILEEGSLLDLAEQVSGDRPRPHPRKFRLPELSQEPRAAQYVAFFRDAQARVVEERRRLHRAGRTVVGRVEGGDPLLPGDLAVPRQPAGRAGELEQRAALGGAGCFLECPRRLAVAAKLEERETAPERVIVVGQVFEPARFQQLTRVVHGSKVVTSRMPCRGSPGRIVGWYTRRRIATDAFRGGCSMPWMPCKDSRRSPGARCASPKCCRCSGASCPGPRRSARSIASCEIAPRSPATNGPRPSRPSSVSRC